MGQVATVTIASVSYSVYGISSDPVTDATEYLNGQLGDTNSNWTGASTDDQKRALITAARWLDRAIEWSGDKTSAAQALEWPRDNATCGTQSVTSGTVPDNIAYAEFLLAGLLLGDASIADSSDQTGGIESLKTGPVTVKFSYGQSLNGRDRLPQIATDLVLCYAAGNGVAASGYVGGDSEESDFTADDFERSEGFA